MNVNDALNKGSLTDAAQSQTRTSSSAASAGKTDNTASTNAAAAATATTSSSAANVQLSPQYQSLGVRSNSPSDSFDAKKVAEIKAAIANGTFQVDPDKVASGVIDTAKDLVSAQQQY